MSDGRDDDGIKIFVYGVRASCPRDLIKTEFSKSGRVTDVFNTGKGYAFVTMEDERDAKMAVEDLNGSSIDGQEVKVEISHGKGTTKGGGGGGRGRDRYDRGGDRGYGRDRDRGGDRGYGGGGRDRFGGGGRDGRRGGGGGFDRRDRYGGGGDRRDDRRDDRGGRDRSYNRRDDY